MLRREHNCTSCTWAEVHCLGLDQLVQVEGAGVSVMGGRILDSLPRWAAGGVFV